MHYYDQRGLVRSNGIYRYTEKTIYAADVITNCGINAATSVATAFALKIHAA